jgi:Tol biopolymer transport system component
VALTAGSRLGPYEILSALGAGGMGEVYRARDTKLGRDVAIKVLPELLASDPERLARFSREAHVLATLNHPNIAHIHGFEDSTGVPALVMELVEGPTLADRIAQGAIPLDEALPIAKQIADAIEAAHEQGIIHRDLKPANIKLRPDGTVKVLDFGLAKALEPVAVTGADMTASPTITSPALTQRGVILGTAAYMSPDQAKGRAADKRSDIWAFGCVLYEMLTGKRAFEGEDVADTLAAVLRGQPDWTALDHVPVPIVRLLRRCLEKDRSGRVADVAVVLFVFSELKLGARLVEPAGRPGLYKPAALVALALVPLMGFAVISYVRAGNTARRPRVSRFDIVLPASQRFSDGSFVLAISEDGSLIAFSKPDGVYVRALDQSEAVRVRGTEVVGSRSSARNPFFSPDARWLGYWQDGQLRKVPVSGGTPIVICPAKYFAGATWGTDDDIVFGQGLAGIWHVPAGGGTPQAIVADPKGFAYAPQLLPGGHAVLFTLVGNKSTIAGASASQIVIHRLDGTKDEAIASGASGIYLPTGHLLYVADGTLTAVPFDVRALKVTGGSTSIAENVAVALDYSATSTAPANFVVSSDGTLLYLTGTPSVTSPRTLAWVDRQGREEPIAAPPRPYAYPRIAPNGRQVALTVRDRDRDIWIWDFNQATLTRLTTDAADDRYSLWTPDSRRILFSSSRGGVAGVWSQMANGIGTAQQVATTPNRDIQFLFPTSMSRNAEQIIVGSGRSGGSGALADLYVLDVGGSGTSALKPLVHSEFIERNGELSPDGRWLAYESNESGQIEIYVRPFPDVDSGRWLVSTSGGAQPLWGHSGRELFYVALNGLLMSATVHATSTWSASPPMRTLEGAYILVVPTMGGRHYDISPDDQRFLVMKSLSGGQSDALPVHLTLVQNWFEELKARVPTK